MINLLKKMDQVTQELDTLRRKLDPILQEVNEIIDLVESENRTLTEEEAERLNELQRDAMKLLLAESKNPLVV